MPNSAPQDGDFVRKKSVFQREESLQSWWFLDCGLTGIVSEPCRTCPGDRLQACGMPGSAMAIRPVLQKPLTAEDQSGNYRVIRSAEAAALCIDRHDKDTGPVSTSEQTTRPRSTQPRSREFWKGRL